MEEENRRRRRRLSSRERKGPIILYSNFIWKKRKILNLLHNTTIVCKYVLLTL